MSQTAVEWLFEQVCNLDWKNLIGDKKKEIFEQAKAMEKEQIIKAFNEGTFASDEKVTAEQYYNETYGADK
jgi:hypothetical protein